MTSTGKPKTVFLVQDPRKSAGESAQLVTRLGYEPVVFETGGACLDALGTGELPLVVILSLEMSPMGGDECCRRIKENQAWRRVAVLITANEQPHEVMRCWRAAADDFLLTPHTAERLGPKLQVLAQAAGSEPSRPGMLEGKSLLVAEPSRLYRTQIGGNLEQAGMQVLYATEGEEALDIAMDNADQLDACLLDTVLPGIDGVTIAEKLRATEQFAQKPIILVSGTEAMSPQLRAAALRLTGADVLDKRTLPFEHILSKVHSKLHPHLSQLRSAERTPFFSLVDFSVDGKTWSSGFSYDVSAGGLFVRTLTPAAANTELHVRVRSIGESATSHSAGVVAWANPYWPRTSFTAAVGMGIRLTRMEPHLATQVARLARAPRERQ